MEQPIIRFVVVIHPDSFNRAEITTLLSSIRAVPLHVLSYSELAGSEHLIACDIVWIDSDGNNKRACTEAEKRELLLWIKEQDRARMGAIFKR